MEQKKYDLEPYGRVDHQYEVYLGEYKRFCEDLLTYVHTLEARIAKLEHNL